jgi:hypothetical protein
LSDVTPCRFVEKSSFSRKNLIEESGDVNVDEGGATVFGALSEPMTVRGAVQKYWRRGRGRERERERDGIRNETSRK